MTGLGNEVQVRLIAEQVALAAIEQYALRFPQSPRQPEKPEIPAPLKWAGAIVAAIMATCTVGFLVWMVSSISALQQTVTRIDERQQITGGNMSDRLKNIEDRLGRLERQPAGKHE